jgi:hypothetical protein
MRRGLARLHEHVYGVRSRWWVLLVSRVKPLRYSLSVSDSGSCGCALRLHDLFYSVHRV